VAEAYLFEGLTLPPTDGMGELRLLQRPVGIEHTRVDRHGFGQMVAQAANSIWFTMSIRRPIQRIAFTAMLFPSVL
jgi:hypothetical protein